jgi:hypothetical protein
MVFSFSRTDEGLLSGIRMNHNQQEGAL